MLWRLWWCSGCRPTHRVLDFIVLLHVVLRYWTVLYTGALQVPFLLLLLLLLLGRGTCDQQVAGSTIGRALLD